MKPVIKVYHGIRVVRDDLLPGGTKRRVIPNLLHGAKEIVQWISEVAQQISVVPEEVWAAAGSGTLIRGLQKAWPEG